MSELFAEVPFDTDPDTIADGAIVYLRAAVPGWEPADGHLEVWLIEALARITAEAAAVAAQVPAAILRAFGTDLVGTQPLEGTAATMTTTWTARDTRGYTIPAGTLVQYAASGDDVRVFRTTTESVITAGGATLTGVEVAAVELGVAGNGVPAGALDPVDALSWVSSVVATTVSAGGVDPETDDAYLDRLTAELRLLTPRPILPDDFAVLARQVTGVTRALAIDGYDPDAVPPTTGNDRMVCLVPLDADGADVAPEVASEVATYLDALREVNFEIKTTTATTTAVDVDYTLAVAPGYASADVLAAVDAALGTYLSPATWAGGDASPPEWRTGQDTVRLLEVASLIRSVPGVAYVATVTLDGSAADFTLDGAAPLPTPGTITGAAV